MDLTIIRSLPVIISFSTCLALSSIHSYGRLQSNAIAHHRMRRQDLFEGDILGITTANIREIVNGIKLVNARQLLYPGSFAKQSRFAYRNAVGHSNRMWLNGIIPYTLSPQFTASQIFRINLAISSFHKFTCIRFVPQTTEEDYVDVYPGKGCYADFGRRGGKQDLSLDPSACLRRSGIPMHEFMHTIGFLHEQNRPDRDEYITIHWENIKRGFQEQFRKATASTTLDLPYDYHSIMHYAATTFSRNGQPTMSAKNQQGSVTLGSPRWTTLDVAKINRLYDCKSDQIEVAYNQSTSLGHWSNARLEDYNNNATTAFASNERSDDHSLNHTMTAIERHNTHSRSETSRSSNIDTFSESAVECVNRFKKCERMAGHGQCSGIIWKPFMRRNCPLACHFCAKAPTPQLRRSGILDVIGHSSGSHLLIPLSSMPSSLWDNY